jgi:hypothetical protein
MVLVFILLKTRETNKPYFFGMVEAFEIIVPLGKTLLRKVGRGVTFVEFLPELKAASTT